MNITLTASITKPLVKMPGKGSKIEFCHGQNQFKVPFIMYADFESILEPIQGPNPAPTGSYTSEVTKHSPSGWCVYSKFAYGEVKDPLKLYRGKDCPEKFCGYIRQEAHRLYHMFPEKPMAPLTPKQWKKYNKASRCHICFKQFGDSKKGPKVRDHCHYTGRYSGPARRNCNLMYRIPSYIPVVFHNLSGYDAHLFIRELGRYSRDTMKVLAKNKEDYISFSVDVAVDKYVDKEGNEKEKLIELRFVDSFKFMSSSLDSLTRNLVKGGEKLFGFDNYSELQYELLTRKWVYPYEYMSSWGKFKESLPPIEAFYSKLNMSKISEDDYQHAHRVWKEFGIRNLGDYHDLYLRTNVVLLANVFEAFRDTFLKHYRLDPAHFYTAPGLAWKACSRKIGVRLDLLTDPDMLLMFERGIRGGITQAVHRYASANNKYMGDLYDPNKESSYLQYLDANNLYGWAMS